MMTMMIMMIMTITIIIIIIIYNDAHIPFDAVHSSFVMKRLLKINGNGLISITWGYLAVILTWVLVFQS